MRPRTITLDEATLRLLDTLAADSPRSRSRSALVRTAVRQFVERERRRQADVRERQILRKHRERLARQVQALVEEQVRV